MTAEKRRWCRSCICWRRQEPSRSRTSPIVSRFVGAPIRKDLSDLEQQGLLQRTYGGAVSHKSSQHLFHEESLDVQAARKEAIARTALEYIHEGDTIILDAGSTTLSLASALVGKFQSLYVITSSVPVALELARAGYELLARGRAGCSRLS